MTDTQRILVIDDSQAVLARAQAALNEAGYEVITTSQTVGTARHLRSCQLVIIDYHMPGIDGGEVLSSLRNAAKTAGSTPLFYLYTSDADLVGKGRALGFDGSFTDKGNDEALVSQVNAAFRLIRLRSLSKKS
ncbi:MAG: response regulator [Myxococcales bacterium]|nr:response regulator [Myxococcales bacterium]